MLVAVDFSLLLLFSETIVAPSTGGVVVSIPSALANAIFTGSTYKPGFLDTLPYIRLEGVSVDTMYTVVLVLMLAYSALLVYPLFTQSLLFRRISGNYCCILFLRIRLRYSPTKRRKQLLSNMIYTLLDPIMRAGDFISERMDVLEKVVKKSISNYRSKKQSLKGTNIDDYLQDEDYYYDYEGYNRRVDDDYKDVGYQDYANNYQYYYN